MKQNEFAPAGKGNMYWFILYIAVLIIFPKLFGIIPGVIGMIIVCFGIGRTVNRINLTKKQKIIRSIFFGFGGTVVALILSVIFALILR